MNKYKVEFTKKAIKNLSKLDKKNAKLIMSWISKNLVDCENPRQYGKDLKGDKKGIWRYRVGDYRILANIQDDKVIIMLLEIGYRKEIYKSH